MPRRAEIQPRQVDADPVYGSVLVTQVINRVMLDGKKSTAEKIVYDALAIAAEKTGKPALEVLDHAVKTVTPVLEVGRGASAAPTTRCRSRCRNGAPARSRSAG